MNTPHPPPLLRLAPWRLNRPTERSMTRDEIYEALRKTLAEELEIDDAKISLQADFKQDLDADSLHLVELAM
ncbi:MAG: acyl carrier protein, partial [Solirubrobacterales bacterium]